MIEASHLVRRYGEFAAVDDVSFSIGAGEVVGLLGHNGAGKTTIMKMLTGFIEPSSGSVKVNGIEVQDDPIAVQRELGYLPENLPLYPELTVCEYLSYAADLRGLDEAQCVPQAIAATQLEDKALDPIYTLSRGYKQRVGVAQAILHMPRYLILDEPSNGLDPNQIQHMRALIRSLASQATVILSTHIMQEVDAVCDRALILRGGQLVVDEKLSDLRRSQGLVLRTAPDAAVPAALAGQPQVATVTQVNEGRWQIDLSEGGALHDQQTAEVAAALVQAGVPVYELAVSTRDLEALFKQVSEQGVASAA